MPARGLDRRALLAGDRRLGFYAAALYQCAVGKCLDGELQSGEGGYERLNRQFAREVTAGLKDMLGSS